MAIAKKEMPLFITMALSCKENKPIIV